MNQTTLSESKRFRQKRLVSAYQESDVKLSNNLDELMEGEEYKLYIRHHSHQLATRIVNAARYNRSLSNGICVVVLVSPKFPQPIFAYSNCKTEDTYSRLVGRVLAKEHLVKSIQNNTTKSLIVSPKAPANISLNMCTYINYIVNTRFPRSTKEKPDVGVPIYHFMKEPDLLLDAARSIAKTFGISPNEISVKHIYLRKYSNKYFDNQYADYSYIKEVTETALEDEVELSSTGGYVFSFFGFVNQEGIKHEVIAISACSDKDHFDKKIGRKLNYLNVVNQKFSTVQITGDALQLPTQEIHFRLTNAILHNYGSEYGYNNYIGSELIKADLQQQLNLTSEAPH